MCNGIALSGRVVNKQKYCWTTHMTKQTPNAIQKLIELLEPHAQTGPDNVKARANKLGVSIFKKIPTGSSWYSRARIGSVLNT